MTDITFYNLLREFLGAIPQPDKEIISTEFRIEMQPGLVSFGGDFISTNNESIPVDLRSVGKPKCSDLTDRIEEFHKTTTENGENKWNKAFITFREAEHVKTEFIWDEELEQENINAYDGDPELVRQKWHWEK